MEKSRAMVCQFPAAGVYKCVCTLNDHKRPPPFFDSFLYIFGDFLLLFSAVLLALSAVLTAAWIPQGGRTGYALAAYSLFCILYTLRSVPCSAMLPNISENTRQRERLNRFRFVLASVGPLVSMGRPFRWWGGGTAGVHWPGGSRHGMRGIIPFLSLDGEYL